VLLYHLHLHFRVDLKHALLRVDAASLYCPNASLGLVLFPVRAQFGVREGLLQVPVVIQSSDLFLRETMQAILKACKNLIRVVGRNRWSKKGAFDNRGCLKTRLQTQSMLRGVEG
jgi:hypothetical protein